MWIAGLLTYVFVNLGILIWLTGTNAVSNKWLWNRFIDNLPRSFQEIGWLFVYLFITLPLVVIHFLVHRFHKHN